MKTEEARRATAADRDDNLSWLIWLRARGEDVADDTDLATTAVTRNKTTAQSTDRQLDTQEL